MDTTIETTDRLVRFVSDQVKARPIEAGLIRRIVKALEEAGNPVVSTRDSEEKVQTLDDIYLIAFNLDEVTLVTKNGGALFLVMGEGYDMLADYNVSLEDALAPVNAYIQSKW